MNEMIKRISTAVDLIQGFGLKKFTREILPWHFSRTYIFYSMDLLAQERPVQTPDSAEKPPAVSDFRLEMADQSDLAHIMAARPHYYTQAQLKNRFQAGHLCFLGWVRNEPVHLRWHFVHSIYLPYIKRDLKLSGQEVWADEGYTKPDYRRSGIFAYAGTLITGTLAEMNFQRLSCAFASWNKTPQRIDRERGMKPVGEILYRNYIFHHTYRYSGSVRKGVGNSIELGEAAL